MPIFKMEDIPGVKAGIYNIKALIRNDVSETLEFLDNLKKSNRTEYKKLITSLNRVAKNGKRCGPKRFRSDAKGTGIYEIKSANGIARVFCFFSKDNSIIICWNTMTKNTGGTKAQNRAFEKCRQIRDEFYSEGCDDL